MENASKALIFAASVLITVMIISLAVYLFETFGETAKTTEARMSQKEIDAFNSKFINYETGGKHNTDDTVTVTYARTATSDSEDREVQLRKLFQPGDVNTVKGAPYYNKALIATAQTLNKPADVVTAINDAIDINYRVNDSYKYNPVEIQTSVEVIVDLSSYKDEFQFSKMKNSASHYQYLTIEPNPNVKAKNIYGLKQASSLATTDTNTKNKISNANSYVCENNESNPNYNAINVYNILSELKDTKVVFENEKSYTVYKYYFFGEVFINEDTGLVETVKFTLVKDQNF